MNTALVIASLVEAATGVGLAIVPSMVVKLLLGAEAGAIGVIVGRFAGIALVGLAISCWPAQHTRQPLYGMTTYNTLALLYLIALGASGTGGFLLWPAVAVHAVLSALLVRGHLTGNQAKPS